MLRYVEEKGSSALIAMPLSLGCSAFILIQKLAREFDSEEFINLRQEIAPIIYLFNQLLYLTLLRIQLVLMGFESIHFLFVDLFVPDNNVKYVPPNLINVLWLYLERICRPKCLLHRQ